MSLGFMLIGMTVGYIVAAAAIFTGADVLFATGLYLSIASLITALTFMIWRRWLRHDQEGCDDASVWMHPAE